MPSLETVSTQRCFGGAVVKYKHCSDTVHCDMVFNVYLPPAVAGHRVDGGGKTPSKTRVPAVFYISGLTCNEDNFITKSGATRYAAELGVMLICPDTSPRGTNCPGEHDSWDFGQSASFNVDATTPEYSKHYGMYSYATKELYDLVLAHLPVDANRVSIIGHSAGGNAALVMALRNPEKYICVSALAPLSNPCKSPIAQKAFSRFLGNDESKWKAYDATELASSYSGRSFDVMVDQGTDDEFLEKDLLTPNFVAAASQNKHLQFSYHLRAGYDHSYFYVASVIEEHLKWHAAHF
ncbi:hypothetical protein RI367_006933 [Sorochytrium milnesiophthora]